MRGLLAALYTCLALGANVALAEGAGDGGMSKLTVPGEPAALPEAVLTGPDGQDTSLAAVTAGKWAVVNFWATWCAPCRSEMPGLDRLQAAMPDLAVVPVATGRNPPEAIARFWDEAGIANLATLTDPKSGLARQMGIAGLPVTVIVNPQGQEVARLIGDAEWDSPAALDALQRLMTAP